MAEAIPKQSTRGGVVRQVIIPFDMKLVPMSQLAIVNFEKRPDDIYRGLELQYLNGGAYGSGYRVIAYRCDGYVDVYDQPSLNRVAEEDFAVTGKGLCEHLTADIDGVTFTTSPQGVQVAFSLVDKAGRRIFVDIEDSAARRTTGMNLLAPIGSSSENPTYLPLFFLEGFDFVRKSSAKARVTIDRRDIRQDNFPVPLPKDRQWRYYSRYAALCQIVEFARAGQSILRKHTVPESGLVELNDFLYRFGSDNTLEGIASAVPGCSIEVTFSSGIPDLTQMKAGDSFTGVFEVSGKAATGSVSGEYAVTRDEASVRLIMAPTGGWSPRPNSMLTRMMFSPRSVFCTWPKTYRFTQDINLQSLVSRSRWERIKA